MTFTLQQALAEHKKGNLERAKALYQQQLSKTPKNTDALQLLGTLLAAQGELKSAIDMLLKSLAVNNQQMPVHANLAICYKRLGWLDKAVSQYKEMIGLDENYANAYSSLIRTLNEQGAFEDAMKWSTTAKKRFPNNLTFLHLEAEIYRLSGQYSDAIAKYQSLLSSHPQRAELRHDYGLTLRLSGSSAEALKQYQTLEKGGVSSYQLFHNMANAFSDMGSLKEAVDYYQKAISLNPKYVDSHINLNELLWELDEKSEFLSSLRQAIQSHPTELDLKYAYCQFLLRLMHYDECVSILRDIPDHLSKDAKYFLLLGKGALGLGLHQQGLEYLRKANKLALEDCTIAVELAEALIENDEVTEAEETLEHVVLREPHNQLAIALQGVCWRLLGDPREEQLNDYENLVKEINLAVPKGYTSIEDFCYQLNNYLDSLHTGTKQPLEQTLTGGTQTRGNLFNDDESIIKELVESIKQAVDEYLKSSDFFARTQLQNSANTIQFTGSWSVRLKSNGHHTSHVHPMGQISSAFYVSLPREVEDESDDQGYFTLGKPNIKTNKELAPKKFVRPQVGKLVLFPSYMWHSTLPFESKEYRTTVAFDVDFLQTEL